MEQQIEPLGREDMIRHPNISVTANWYTFEKAASGLFRAKLFGTLLLRGRLVFLLGLHPFGTIIAAR